MHFMLNELGRLWCWVRQGSNPNIILVIITAVYVYLTYKILVYSTLQAREELRPNIVLNLSQDSRAHGLLRIQNVGRYSATILDVSLTRYEDYRFSCRQPLDVLQGALLGPGTALDVPFDLTRLIHTGNGGPVAYRAVVVASDSSERIFVTHDYRSHVRVTLMRSGCPLRIRIRMLLGPVRRAWCWLKGGGPPLV
jgi:hypothetical protein